MTAAKKQGQMISSPDTPTGAAAFHTVPNQGKDIAFHTSQPGVMDDARLTGRRNFNAPVIVDLLQNLKNTANVKALALCA